MSMSEQDLPDEPISRPDLSEPEFEHVPGGILGYISDLLKSAATREQVSEQTGKNEVYITHDALTIPQPSNIEGEDTDMLTLMLTRDGETPEFEEPKERIYLYIPPRPAWVYVEHVLANGTCSKFSVGENGIWPYDDRIPGQENESVGETPAVDLPTDRRIRDMIRGFRLTPQVVR